MTRLTKVKRNHHPVQRGESTASIYTYNAGLKSGWQRSAKSILTCAGWKTGASGWRILSDRQVPTVHPLAAPIQRGTQAESQSVRPEKWFQRQDKVI